MRRHDLAWIRPQSWRRGLGGYAADTLVREWATCNRPLVKRRSLAGEPAGVSLGLPTPPADGKRRLVFLFPLEAIDRVMRPPTLADSLSTLPLSWHCTAARISLLGEQHAVTMRVFGSAAFQLLTGLDFLTPASDLDLLIEIGPETDLVGLAADLTTIAQRAPMRLDGEFMGPDGAACKWREIGRDSDPVLIRTADGLSLGPSNSILSGGAGI
ncbi:phosphoribosyl-dephospho-CoA transferase [Kaistia soli DSM 19436]|uniref:Phosphoribosyl-dephospho-CoA transferase n=1 Tax=Kaistia soli DSM 19436 TaxID=1122133 RepID=A0A1M5L441_9HYPH|nr:malonate decarboxylase holo-[acyl-carrier-protein] synthase [Kaistia soli]SHG59788.1 phosphoribosyl-dephospho-CoA transferase [Kaistia soli DSM 19436]